MSDLPVLLKREGQNAKIAELEAEVERLRARISALEQALSQAGDSIELAEAEQRGFERGYMLALAENERLWAENMALKLAKKS